VCKSKHKILITKYLTPKKSLRNSILFSSESLGRQRIPFSRCPRYMVATPIGANGEWYQKKKT